jgi:hypothetical protein
MVGFLSSQKIHIYFIYFFNFARKKARECNQNAPGLEYGDTSADR